VVGRNGPGGVLSRPVRRFPPEFIERYSRFIPDFDAFLAAMQSPLKRTARVNQLKAEPGQVYELLGELGLTPLPWYQSGFTVEQGEKLGKRIEHFIGLIYVQEAASMVPPLVLAPEPGERVLDVAAAPGSKTTQIAGMMRNTGLLIANDSSPVRARALIGNVDRAGCLNTVVCRLDGNLLGRALDGTCDRVLVDAPCSSEGTIRKSPQVLDSWSTRQFEVFARAQRRLIAAGYQALRPGGLMVYSTCTLAPEENEAVVASLLSRQPEAELCDFELAGLLTRPGLSEWLGEPFPDTIAGCRRILPQDNDTEPFFVACIRKGEDALRH
jgi:tRNA (cytosine49-C5)-methyltransferase